MHLLLFGVWGVVEMLNKKKRFVVIIAIIVIVDNDDNFLFLLSSPYVTKHCPF